MKRSRIILIGCMISFCLSFTQAWADYPFYHFTNQDVKINKLNFLKYVQPQVRGVIQDYYSLFKRMQVYQIDLMGIHEELAFMQQTWEQRTPECRSLKDCAPEIDRLTTSLIKLDKLSLENLEHGFTPENKNNVTLHYKLPKQEEIKQQLLVINTKVHSLLQQLYMEKSRLMTEPKQINITKPFEIMVTEAINSMGLKAEEVLFYALDPQLRTPNEQLWNNFIRPLEQKVAYATEPDQFVRLLGEFNLEINSYHMRMLKSNIKLGGNYEGLIETMHSRWNTILKGIL